jgi:4-amino-4-deoxy-L-arabinose transferase-like glycosyltransferase
MRRLLRWTFHAMAVASLLLCLATAALWVRSYWAYDQFVAQRRQVSEGGVNYIIPHSYLMVESYRGQLSGWVFWSERPEPHHGPPWELVLDCPPSPKPFTPPFYWLVTERVVSAGYAYHSWRFGVRAWLIVSAFAVLPAVATFRQVRVARRRRRARLGRCVACGYDLRATPERCPECGVIPSRGAA